jgi:hypothetical protein
VEFASRELRIETILEARSIEPRVYRTTPYLATRVETRHIGILAVGTKALRPLLPYPYAEPIAWAPGVP